MSTEQGKGGSQESGVDRTRRALLHAGWIVPAVIALKLPSNAFASYATPTASATVTATTPVVSATVSATVTAPTP